jgi:hypothetical protein
MKTGMGVDLMTIGHGPRVFSAERNEQMLLFQDVDYLTHHAGISIGAELQE